MCISVRLYLYHLHFVLHFHWFFSDRRVMYLLGYIPKDNRVYLGDKELNVVSYSLLLSVLEYQTAVMRRDFDTADKVLPTVPREQRTRVAHFLEKQVTTTEKLLGFFRLVVACICYHRAVTVVHARGSLTRMDHEQMELETIKTAVYGCMDTDQSP